MYSKKHLNFTSLRNILSDCFNQIEDVRQQGKCNYSIHDAMMSSFACMYFQDPSLIEFQRRITEPQNRNNLKTMFEVENIPKDNQIRNIVDSVDSRKFNSFFKEYFHQLQRGKYLKEYEILPNMYAVSMDATGYFSSDSISCPHCLKTKHKAEKVDEEEDYDEENKKTTYAHKALQVAIVHPNKKQVIPLMPEEIINTDGKTKQDCENNAAKRLIPKLRKDHPQLNMMLLGDDLYSRQPVIEKVIESKMHYLFVSKPTSHKYLKEWIDAYNTLPKQECRNNKGERYVMSWMNEVPLHGDKNAIKVNYLYCEVYKKDEKTGIEKRVYKNSWVTDIELNKNNVYKLSRAGRCRWKIENECFNTLKNQGYNIEHNYGHGEENLCFNFYLLTLIAFSFHQVFELTDKLYQACRIKYVTKREMWDFFKSAIKFIIFDNWEQLMMFALEKDKYKLTLLGQSP